jgi:hypothetical protein
MSRLPLRDLFRLVRSGLEKVALACAAFGLMHASARAGESASAGPAADDPWSARTAPQLAADDAWSNPKAPSLALDDAWSAPAAERSTSSGRIYAASPASSASASNQGPRPAAMQSAPSPVATPVQEAPAALTMDRSYWNETPRGRSPGLIASHDAWLNRITPVAKPSEPAKAPVQSAPAPPTDPWSAPLTGLVTSNSGVTAAPAASAPAIDTGTHPSSVGAPHARLQRVSEAPGALRSEASPTVLAAGRPVHRRPRPMGHSISSSPRSPETRRARATRAPTPAWCRSVSASARHRGLAPRTR